MVFAVLFSAFTVTDVHAEEILNQSTCHVSINSDHHCDVEGGSENQNGEVHFGCHHIGNIFVAFVEYSSPAFSSRKIDMPNPKPQLMSDLKNKLIRPPRT